MIHIFLWRVSSKFCNQLMLASHLSSFNLAIIVIDINLVDLVTLDFNRSVLSFRLINMSNRKLSIWHMIRLPLFRCHLLISSYTYYLRPTFKPVLITTTWMGWNCNRSRYCSNWSLSLQRICLSSTILHLFVILYNLILGKWSMVHSSFLAI